MPIAEIRPQEAVAVDCRHEGLSVSCNHPQTIREAAFASLQSLLTVAGRHVVEIVDRYCTMLIDAGTPHIRDAAGRDGECRA
jgi:hypothetical protein